MKPGDRVVFVTAADGTVRVDVAHLLHKRGVYMNPAPSRDGWIRVRMDNGEWEDVKPEDVRVLSLPELVGEIEPPEFTRAGGDTICPTCRRAYYDHARDLSPGARGYDGSTPLTILCDGRRVKL